MSTAGLGWRGRLLGALAELGLKSPRAVFGGALAAIALAGWVVSGLSITSSRTGLVGDDDPSWNRLRTFYETFGRPNPIVVVVTGGSEAERRTVVDALHTELEADEEFEGRVLGRLSADTIAPLALLHQPDALMQARRALPPEVDLGAVVSGGLPAWFSTIEAQIYAGLDGAGDTGAAPPMEEVAAGLGRLAGLAVALADVLSGSDPLARMLADGSMPAQPGIDGRGYVVSGDETMHLVSVFAELPSDEASELSPVVARVEAARNRAMAGAPAGVDAILTGTPKFIVEELEVIQRSTLTSSVTTTLGIALLCLLLFRSLRQTVIALLPLGPGVLITLAAVRLLYSDLNLITSSFIAALLGLGIDFSVHVLARFHEERRRGADPEEAVRRAMVHTGPGVGTGAVVTAAAFLTTMTTDFTAFGELGLITAIGLVVVALATFLLLPPLLARAGGEDSRPSPEVPGLSSLARGLKNYRKWLLGGGVALGLLGGAGLGTIEWNPRYFDFLPDDTESARGIAALEYDPLASPVFANLSAPDLETARTMTQTLRAMPSVAGVQSPSDLLPPLDEAGIAALRAGFAGVSQPDFAALAQRSTKPEELALAATKVVDALQEARAALRSAGQDVAAIDPTVAAFTALAARAKTLDAAGAQRLGGIEARAAALMEPAWTTAAAVAERGHVSGADLPLLFRARYAALDGGPQVALYAVPAGHFWDRVIAGKFSADVRTVDPDASGLALDHVSHGDLVLDGFLRAAVIATVVIFVLLIADFGGPRDALLALLPTVLGWLWMFGVMAAFRMQFNVANIVCLPLVLGIGVAFGVHFMHRVREEADASLDTVLRGTGGAIAIAALTTMVGFAGLVAGRYGGMQSLGITMVIGIMTSMVATVCVLPATLLIRGRLR